jgi:glucosamine--fructose-6-phosphate aminotransferase (isomerizing)
LAPDSPLDAHSRKVIQQIYDEEWAKSQELPTDDPLDPKRRKRVDWTWEEIWSQPQAIVTTLVSERQAITEAAGYFSKLDLDRIYMTGCGDSIAVMIAMRGLFEQLLGIPCEPVQALDLTYYYYRTITPKTLVITLSSSGATTRTVEAMMLGRARGAYTLALSNTPGSPLMEESDRGLTIHAQRKGWPTQSSTAAMAILVQLLLEMARLKGSARELVDPLQAAFQQIPGQIAHTLETVDAGIRAVADTEADRKIYLFSGGGQAYASALFGAAKVRECSPDHSLAIPLEEFHHYNSQKAGDPLFLIAPHGPSVPRALDTLHEGKRWGGQVYSVVSNSDAHLFGQSDRIFPLAEVPETLSAFLYTIPVQLFAYHLAMAKFHRAESATQSLTA